MPVYRFFCLLLVFISFGNVSGQPNLQWSHSLGGTDRDLATNLATDNNGDVILTGTYTNSIDLDPTGSTTLLTSTVLDQPFVAKYANSGSLEWGFNLPQDGRAQIFGLCTDSERNIIITGSFRDTVDMDPGSGTNKLDSDGSNDIFLAKLDPDGELLWAYGIGANGYDIGYSLATDSNDNIYLSATYGMEADFDPSSGTTPHLTGGRAFVKYNKQGAYQWGFNLWSTSNTLNTDLAVDDDYLYVKGAFYDTTDLDPSAAELILVSSNRSLDHFLARYKLSDGSLDWGFQFGGLGDDQYGFIEIDEDNVYVAGEFEGTVLNFNHKDSSAYLGAINGGKNVFLASYRKSDGQMNWVKRAVGGEHRCPVVDMLRLGNEIMLLGWFDKPADFDPSLHSVVATPSESVDLYLARYTTYNGSLRSVNQLNEPAYPIALAYSGTNGFTIAGIYQDTVNTDFLATHSHVSAGWLDLFLASYEDVRLPVARQAINPIILYPNPSAGYIQVEIPPAFTPTRYRVINTMGQINTSGSWTEEALNLSTLPPGFYFLQLEDGTMQQTIGFTLTRP